jgi:PadR family transcriptional regulator PadR
MAAKEPRLTRPSLLVLRYLLDHRGEKIAGAQISRELRVLSGTLYPLLIRFESAGWLDSKWETIDPSEVGRPRRRLYRLTPRGAQRAAEELASLGAKPGVLAWN